MYESEYGDLSYSLENASNQMWSTSIDLSNTANDFWVNGETELFHDFDLAAVNAEWYSNLLEEASWEAYYGPVNSEGYTAYDASMGYTTSDTSFIEPASSASSTSLISDNTASYL